MVLGGCEMTREEACKKAQIIDFQGGYTIALVTGIYNDHEAQLKAKDEEIERLKAKLTLCDDAYSKVANDFESAVMKIERLESDVYHMAYVIKKWQGTKARSIVAMLFWDMKEYDRCSKVNNVQDYVNNKNKFYALESVFKKAYKMLKDRL